MTSYWIRACRVLASGAVIWIFISGVGIFAYAASSDERGKVSQSGKSVVNLGDKPLTVVVTTQDGKKQELLVPPKSEVPLPPRATKVDRDARSVMNKSAENSRVQVVGDGKEVDLPPAKTVYKDGKEQNIPPDRQVTFNGEKQDLPGVVNPTGVVLDPDRPEVMSSGAEPISGDGNQFTGREGKTVVNQGDKPLTVVVTTQDGQQKEVLIPPKSGVALPPGTTKVDRDEQSMWNKSAENSKVQVVGDGKEIDLPAAKTVYKDGKEQNIPPDRQVTVRGEKQDLPGVENPAGVVLDPDRPGVISSGAEPISGDGNQFTGREGKTVVNQGDKPLTVVVTTQDGQKKEVLIPPNSGVALPPGTTKVDRDEQSMWNKDAGSSKVQVVGDGKEVDLPPAKSTFKDGKEQNIPPDRQVTVNGEKRDLPGVENPTGVVLDPDRPGVISSGAEPLSGDGNQFTGREGKTVVNQGDKPLTVVVTTEGGQKKEVLIPPNSGVALPPGTTKVDRDERSMWNKDAENSKVQVVGDGKEIDLPATKAVYKDGQLQNIPPDRQVTFNGDKQDLPGVENPTGVVLDPDRPGVMSSGAEPLSGDGNQFTGREGKTVVNQGDKPLTVVVTTQDGQQKEILIPPNSGVALPPGTTKVDRDEQSMWNKDAGNSKVQVVGDGKEVDLPPARTVYKDGKLQNIPPDRQVTFNGEKQDLPGVVNPAGVVLDPDRPGVMSSGAEPLSGDGNQFTGREGKTVVNQGDKPLTVVVTTEDGQQKEILVPPNSGVALPPGTMKVDRDTKSMWNKDAENSKVQVVGDGNEVDLPGTQNGTSVLMDPKRPGVVLPEGPESSADGEKPETVSEPVPVSAPASSLAGGSSRPCGFLFDLFGSTETPTGSTSGTGSSFDSFDKLNREPAPKLETRGMGTTTAAPQPAAPSKPQCSHAN